MFGWVNNREAGDLRLNRAHYDVTVMDIRNGAVQYNDTLCYTIIGISIIKI